MRDNEVVVGLDGMASLGWRRQDHTHYMGTEDPDGTIHLVPAVHQHAVLSEVPAAEGELDAQRTRDTLEILREWFPNATEITE
jgi:hypothetical protein